MSDSSNVPAPTRGRPFAPGQSGNPAGRPAGSRNHASLAVEKLLLGEAEALTRRAIEKALEGDMVALRLCIERIAPRRTDRLVAFDLPPIASCEDAERAGAGVLAAAAAGQLTAREAGLIMAALVAQTNLFEAGSYERRLVEVEAIVHHGPRQ